MSEMPFSLQSTNAHATRNFLSNFGQKNSTQNEHDGIHDASTSAVGCRFYGSVSHGWTAAEAFAPNAKGESASRRLWARCDGDKRTTLAAAQHALRVVAARHAQLPIRCFIGALPTPTASAIASSRAARSQDAETANSHAVVGLCANGSASDGLAAAEGGASNAEGEAVLR